jgi:hypothetical protein
MKFFSGLLFLFVIMVCVSACGKEQVKYQKMPDNGNVQLNCPQVPK